MLLLLYGGYNFQRINMVPGLFSDIKLSFENCNKTCIEYALENFGENIVFNFPLGMIETGRFVRDVYPFSITMGIIDCLERGQRRIHRHAGYS